MRQKILSLNFLIPVILITVIYVLLTVYLMNAPLVFDTVTGSYPVNYKFKLLFALLGGMWTAMGTSTLMLIVITALLTGVNLVLLTERISSLKNTGKLHLTVGGGTVLGIVGSGCAACGLPVLTLLGLSGSLMILPFRGVELSYISVILLAGSLFLMLRSRKPAQNCEVNKLDLKKSSAYFLTKVNEK